MAKQFNPLLSLALLLLLAGCGREAAPASFALDWLDGSSVVHETNEKLDFAPRDLLSPWNRGFGQNVTQLDDGEEVLWSLDRRAVLEFEILHREPRRLLLDATAVDGDAELQVEVRWDGQLIQTLNWEGRTTQPLELGAERLAPGLHRLELLVSELRPSPYESGLDVGLGLHGLRFAGADEGPKLRWRWCPIDESAALVLQGQATGESELAVWADAGDGRWLPLRRLQLATNQRFDERIALTALSAQRLARVAVVEQGDAIEFSALRQELQKPRELDRRNCVLLTLDTTRRDALGAYRALDPDAFDYGGGDSPTPRLDAIAQRAQFYERAYTTAPVTAPTHASLFLGSAPSMHGLRNNGQPLLRHSNAYLPALLEAWGYRNAAFVSLGVLAHDLGFAQGFAHFDDRMFGWQRDATAVNDSLRAWLAQNPTGGPRFVWLHYSDPHFPYGPEDAGQTLQLSWDGGPETALNGSGRWRRFELQSAAGWHELKIRAERPARFRLLRLRFSHEDIRHEAGAGVHEGEGAWLLEAESTLRVFVPEHVAPGFGIEIGVEEVLGDLEQRRRYVDDVRHMDAAIGEALELLGAAGIYDEDALLLAVADHGEDLGLEDGRFGHVEHVRPSLGWIPMLLEDRRQKPGRIAEPVGIVDLAPTLAARLGLPRLPGWEGADLGGDARDRALHLESLPPEASEHWRGLIRDGRLLLGGLDRARQLATPLRLYDLAGDPHCRRDLWNDPSLAAATKDALRAEWSRWIERGDWSQIEVDARMQERLRALGYVE